MDTFMYEALSPNKDLVGLQLSYKQVVDVKNTSITYEVAGLGPRYHVEISGIDLGYSTIFLVAKEDLIRIHHYGVDKFGIIQADKYFDTFFEYFNSIANSPFSFESVDFIKEGYRRCVCGSDSIYYRIDERSKTVEIMAIVGKQDLNRSL